MTGLTRIFQILAGPRLVGKTTMARQALAKIGEGALYASADEPVIKDGRWVEQQWEVARLRTAGGTRPVVLLLDEIQKIPDWSATVKHLWDSDSMSGTPIRIVLLGSSPMWSIRWLKHPFRGTSCS